jgi:hypothetical protein
MKIDSINIILKFSKVISIVSLVISSLITLLLLYLLFGGSLEGSIMVDSSINQMKGLKEYTNFNLVPFLIKLFMVLFIVTILILINTILRSWENFMSLVDQGRCFEIDTIKNLKYISFILTGIWAVLFISDIITETTVFTSISFQNTINDYSPSESLNSFDASFSLHSLAYLIVATILWVISHILIQGIKLKKENELTI